MTNLRLCAHPFEESGLGKAPFKVIGVEYRRGPIRSVDPKTGIVTEVGSPGQPMGCCKHCFTGIAECWVIQSADGNVFDVGSSCVRKTDKKLAKQAAPYLREIRHEAEAKRIERAKATFERADVRSALEAKPHPFGLKDRATDRLLNRADWVDYMFQHAGNAGKIRAAKQIERVATEVDDTEGGRS